MHPLKGLKKSKKRALIIAAHPDDESLFMGGTIAEFKRWRWTVLCVTDCDEKYNRRRRQELLRACGIYARGGSRVIPFTLGIVKKRARFSKVEVSKRIRGFIDEFGPFDIAFTHGDRGDYGHRTHKLIHDVVRGLGLPNLYIFVTPDKKTGRLKSEKNIQSISLSPKSRFIKRRAIDVYLRGSQKTNLSRLKRVVSYALNAREEAFIRCN